jgi:hypothetical protein
MGRKQMMFHRLGLAVVVTLVSLAGPAIAAEPILLRYRFTKGDQFTYRTTHEEKQSQTIADQKVESTIRQEVVTSLAVDEIDGDGNAVIKTKAMQRKRKMDGQGGKYEFDSKSTERDTGSEIGGRVTPVLERLTGSEYEFTVTRRGKVTRVTGYTELLADLVKDNLGAALQAGVLSDDDGQKQGEQERFIVFSDKPVSPGDNWEDSVETDLKGVGMLKGKMTYTYEGDDKVGQRRTVRIGVKTDLSIDLNLDALGIKLTGTMTTTSSSGTVQFDPVAGRIVSSKSVTGMTGQLNLEVGGMMLPLANSEEHTDTLQLLDKVPE